MDNTPVNEIHEIHEFHEFHEFIDGQDLCQCAWCKCLMLDGVRIKEEDEVLEISHGICLKCRNSLEKEISLKI